MGSRSWRWFTVRVQGLINHPTRLTRIAAKLRPPPDQGGPHA